jgi:hypothetical protein
MSSDLEQPVGRGSLFKLDFLAGPLPTLLNNPPIYDSLRRRSSSVQAIRYRTTSRRQWHSNREVIYVQRHPKAPGTALRGGVKVRLEFGLNGESHDPVNI